MTTDLIDRYFQLAASPDREAYFALFADDVVAEDDGHTYDGIDAVRAWRADVPDVTYVVTDVSDESSVATAEVAGDFPGSPVSLRFHFVEVEDGLIRRLVIAP